MGKDFFYLKTVEDTHSIRIAIFLIQDCSTYFIMYNALFSIKDSNIARHFSHFSQVE